MNIKPLMGKVIVLAVIALVTSSVITLDYAQTGGGSVSTPTKQTSDAIHHQQIHPVFHRMTIDDGLTHNSVFHVLQDRQGFIWTTTVAGINKYDGMAVTNFTPQAAGSHSTPQFYQTMLEDRDGILWFCNYGAGLVRHDPVRNTWKYYQHDDKNPNSLAHNTTWFVFQDRNGILWVSTFGGLSRFDPATEQFTNYLNDPNNPNSLANPVATQVQQATDGMLWVGTYGGGLDRFDPTSKTFTHHRHDPINPNSLSDNNVESVWLDPDGSIWVGTDNGLNHFDPVSGRTVRYFHDEKDDTSLSHNFVVRVMRDSHGQLWVSTWGGGLNRFDEKNQRFVRYQNDPHDPDSLSSDLALYFSEDRSGALWFGTMGGINTYDPAGQRFARYQHLPDNPNSLPAGRVRAITQDKDGIFWIAMWDQGLVRFDRKNNTYTRYKAEPNNPNSLSNDNIFDIRYDPRGWLWVATTAGLNKFDLSSKTWTQYRADPANPKALVNDWISGVEVDAKGDLWLAVYGAGLYHFDPISKIFTRYSHDPNNPDSMAANENLNYVKAAADGKLWVGGDASVSLFDPVTKKAVNFSPDQHGISGLTSDQTYQDRQGKIWVATYSGVNKFDPVNNRFTPYPDIRAVLADDAQGKLWVIAGKSLARFDPNSGSLRRYDEYDGLLSNALEPTAGYASPDGEIFVGGAKGFNSFFPDQLPNNLTPPPVVLTGFELLSKPVTVGADSLLQKDISVTERITLPYDYTALTLKFAALNYRSPAKNLYAYKLDGFDKDWMQTVSSNRQANYTNLDPGEYTFRVKAANNDGIWNQEGTALTIRITPPWWETWWFLSLASALLLGLAFTGYQLRVLSLKRYSQKLEGDVTERTAQLEEKNKELEAFSYSVSHDLRSPLRHIDGYLALLKEHAAATLDAKSLRYMETVTNSTRRMNTLIDDLLSFSRMGRQELCKTAVGLGELVTDVVQEMGPETEGRDIDWHIADLPVVTGDLSMLHVVLVNLISNALKYSSKRDQARIEIGTLPGDGSETIVYVRDNGAGFDMRYIDKLFGVFQRLHSIEEFHGNGIGLATVLRIISRHGGRTWAEGKLDEGATFYFTLPNAGA